MPKKVKSKTATQAEQEAENKWADFAKAQENMQAEPEFQAESDSQAEQEDPQAAAKGIDFTSREEFENQLNALERELNESKEQALRVQAEAENTRRRAEREISNAHKFGSEKLLGDLLPVLDSLSRGIEGPEPQDKELKNMRQGIVLTVEMLEKTLEKHGVKAIDPAVGEVFNPDYHQAMSMQPDPEAESNTILQVLQKGYELNGRVLRAAMVMVAQ